MNINLTEQYRTYLGEVEFEFRDINGNFLSRQRENNIIKIFAKEIMAHRIPYSKIWDPNAGSGAGDWVDSGIDIDEFAAKYFVFGASFDESGNPLDQIDTRFYTYDQISGSYIPTSLGTGSEYDGGLINAVPISEPNRPLKRVERIYFEPSYQPAGTPLLQNDVRAMNNVLVLETTLTKDEYNGLGVTANEFFTITEVALVGAREVGALGECEDDPRDIFLTGPYLSNTAYLAIANQSSTVTLDVSETDINGIKEGDQIKIVVSDTTSADDAILNQVNPYYLVVSKSDGGRDIVLDRTPSDDTGTPLSGSIGILRDGFRIYSHRILKNPFKKNSDVVVTCRWRIIMN